MKKMFLFFAIVSSNFACSKLPEFWNLQQVLQDYQKDQKLKHTGEKPVFFQIKPYNSGSYVQFNFDAKDFVFALMVKMTAQTMYAMAHTGTRIENFKTAVWRPGIARTIINWVPFFVTCSFLASMKEKKELIYKLGEAKYKTDHPQVSINSNQADSK